ncbi:MAG: hypothetical protein JW876_03240 [Candidatus Krumholzibacteriota bacterium]|nr:hypothetical protein [Candidatus Krumholzibacteriota bacterium]
MAAQVVRIAEPTPGLGMEIARLVEETGTAARWTPDAELFAVLGGAGSPLGIALAERLDRDGVIHLVAARPGGEGTGSALVNHLLLFLSTGCDRVFVVAGPAGGFFERFGFRIVPAERLPGELRGRRAVREALDAGCRPMTIDLARRPGSN